MLDEVRALLILQDRDRRLLELARNLDKLPQDEARATAKLADHDHAVSHARNAVLDCEMRLKRLELDAATRQTTIQRLKLQQFETRKNDEYQAIGHEISRYEKDIDALETRELELMEEMDGARAALQTALAAQTHDRALIDEDLAAIAQRRQRLEAEAREVTAERDALAAKVPDTLLPLYQRLMKSKGGLAVAPLQDGKCGGCHMKLIAATVVSVQSGRELARCEDCGRILYLED